MKIRSIVLLLILLVFAGCTNPWMENLVNPLVKDKSKEKDEGIVINVNSYEEWKTAIWLIEDLYWAGNNGFTIILTSDITVTDADPGGSTFSNDAYDINVTVIGNKTITLSGTGSLLNIVGDQTVILQNIDLKGNTSTINDLPLVCVSSNSTFIMLGSASVSGNTTSTFPGSGVYVDGGTFIMNSGTVSGNTASGNGGGVYVTGDGSFTMNGGAVSGNTATSNGGGVYVDGGTFTMNSGTVSGNTASGNGGGVYVTGYGGSFFMDGGMVYGDESGSIPPDNSASSGTALYVNGSDATVIVGGSTYLAGPYDFTLP